MFILEMCYSAKPAVYFIPLVFIKGVKEYLGTHMQPWMERFIKITKTTRNGKSCRVVWVGITTLVTVMNYSRGCRQAHVWDTQAVCIHALSKAPERASSILDS